MSRNLDFKDIRERVSIEDAARLLRLVLKKEGVNYRCRCPTCNTESGRSLEIMPQKKRFKCHSSDEGGSCLDLVMHIQGVSLREAAEFLSDTPPHKAEDTRPQNQKAGTNQPTFTGLDYLEPDHPMVQEIGFEPEMAAELGIGYAGRGTMKGHVLIPVRLDSGQLTGYIGIMAAKLPKEWHLSRPENVVPFKKKA